MTLGATVPWAHQARTARRPCRRCGIEREARRSTVLCADCKKKLTPAEASAWKDAA